jgi:hypothetical protein
VFKRVYGRLDEVSQAGGRRRGRASRVVSEALMKARLTAIVVLVAPLWSCGDISVASATRLTDRTFGFGGLDGLRLSVERGRLRVDESVHVTAHIVNPTLKRLQWGLPRPGAAGDVEILGFVCVPTTACAIERIGLTRNGDRDAVLRLSGATEVTTRLRALSPGESTIWAAAYTNGPCGSPPEECGPYAFAAAGLTIDP